MRLRWPAAASVLVALTAGCGHGSPRPDSAPGKRTIVVSRLDPAVPTVLPPQACFVGIRSYDVMLFGLRLRAEDTCSKVADDVFRGAKQLPWSAKHYYGSDQVEECELARGGGRLQILRDDPDLEGPRFDVAYDLTEKACARLERDGWKIIFQEK